MKCCPTCRGKLPPEVTAFWERVKLAGHAPRCQCSFCRNDVAAVIAQVVPVEGETKEQRRERHRQIRYQETLRVTARLAAAASPDAARKFIEEMEQDQQQKKAGQNG